jgi:hypothetical protein
VNILSALTPVARAFKFLGVRYYVGGSMASSVRGLPRTSIDVDVVAELLPQHVRPLAGALAGEFYVSELRVREAVEERRSFSAIHLATMMKVDVFASQQRPFDRALFDRVTSEFLDAVGTSIPHPVPRSEDVVLLKLDWYRTGGEIVERQWEDVLGVLKVAAGDLDGQYLSHWANDLGLADLLERALAEAATEI